MSRIIFALLVAFGMLGLQMALGAIRDQLKLKRARKVVITFAETPTRGQVRRVRDLLHYKFEQGGLVSYRGLDWRWCDTFHPPPPGRVALPPEPPENEKS